MDFYMKEFMWGKREKRREMRAEEVSKEHVGLMALYSETKVKHRRNLFCIFFLIFFVALAIWINVIEYVGG